MTTMPTHWDAVHEAHRRAGVTGRRYRVWREPNNQLWTLTEMHVRWRLQ